MTDWIYILDYSLTGAMLTMMALGIAFSVSMPSLDKWSRRYFITLFSLFFLCTVTCFLALLLWEKPTMAAAASIVYLFEGLLLSTPIFMPTIFLLHSCGEKLKSSLLFRLVLALMGIYFVIMISTRFTNVFYYVTQDNQFFRGSLWWVWLTPLVLIMLLNIAGVIRRRQKLTKKYFTALLVYLVPMSVTITVHMFFWVELFVIFGIASLALIMFVLILWDNMEQYAKQQREIAHQRTDIMVLQMRPHFIYNTMSTIYYLCKLDSDKAQQVTKDFTTYLRQNFTAIASENTIPFSEELKHTQAYLTVEQAQHEDNLFMEFDTPHTVFRIPPLTLQPLVENAVKHGMRTSDDPIHISVTTRLTDKENEIIVEDNGPGYDPTNDNEPHIALNNIRERLKAMCGGSLEITPREGGGTKVIIRIPLK